MNILDKLATWLDRREVTALRKKVQEYAHIIERQEKKINEQISQIYNANLRVSRMTNELLDYKRENRVVP